MPLLLLFLRLSQALWIDLPFIEQDKNGCGSASVWMLLEHWKHGTTPPLQEIHRQLYSEEAGGIYARDMETYLRSRGFRTFTFRGEWKDLEHHISQGRPLIVCLERNARGVPLHYVVVAGVDPVQNLVLVNDPAQRKLMAIGRAEFERAWKGTDNWTLLAAPEIDLASRAFREEKHGEAKDHLNSALRSNPSDTYANDFLATVYFLESNVESALKYWNRIGKPQIQNIVIDPPLRLDPVLLDRSIAFSRGESLTLDKYRTTHARLESMGIFSRVEMELTPSGEESFDVTLRAAERGISPLSWFRGVGYRTVHPEIFNIGGKAVNVRSMYRWNPERKRANLAVSAPLSGSKWRYEIAVDDRRQEWSRSEVSAQITSVQSGRWTWTSGLTVAGRPLAGNSLKYVGSSSQTLINVPERRFAVKSTVTAEAGRVFGGAPSRFGKLIGRIDTTWRPLTVRLRSGAVLGTAPVDEFFVLGLDRDHELWLRATPERAAVRSFVLANVDVLKEVYDWSLFNLSVGPFVDAAHASRWLVDTGMQVRLGVLGAFSASLSFGKNLRTGENIWFVTTSH